MIGSRALVRVNARSSVDLSRTNPHLVIGVGFVSFERDLDPCDPGVHLDRKEVGDPDEVAVHHHPRARGLGGYGDIADELLFQIFEEVDEPWRERLGIESVARVVEQELAEIVGGTLELSGRKKSPRSMLERTLLESDDLRGHFLLGSPLIVHRIDDLGEKVDGLRLPLRILEELERFLELLREPEQELLLLERQRAPRWSGLLDLSKARRLLSSELEPELVRARMQSLLAGSREQHGQPERAQ